MALVDPEEMQVIPATSRTSDQTHDQMQDLNQTEAVHTYCIDELQTEDEGILHPEGLGKTQMHDSILKQIRIKMGEKDSS